MNRIPRMTRISNPARPIRCLRALGRNQSGFTLMELTIVLVVLAVLAAIAYPTYKSFTRKAYRAEAVQLLNEARSAVWAYRLENDKWPSDLSAAWTVRKEENWSLTGGPDENADTFTITATGQNRASGIEVTIILNSDGSAKIH